MFSLVRWRIRAVQFFRSDRAILFICMAIALVFWLVIQFSDTHEAKITVQLDYLLPPGKTLLEPPRDEIVAEVRATGWELRSIYRSEGVTVTVPLNSVNKVQTITGSQLRENIIAQLDPNQKKNLQVRGINVRDIVLELENLVERQVRVELNGRLEMEPRYQLRDTIEIVPAVVTLQGPASVVLQADSVVTETFVIGATIDSAYIPLRPPSASVTRVIPDRVKLIIEREQITEKSLIVPIEIRNAPDSVKILPETVTVTFAVGAHYYDRVRPSSFTAYIDLKGARPNATSNTIPVQVEAFPEYIQDVNYRPQAVSYYLLQ